MNFVATVFLGCMSLVFCLPSRTADNKDSKHTHEVVNADEHLIRSYYEKATPLRDDRRLGFSWSNCAKGSDLTINKLTISPDPITIPGNVTIGLDATIATKVTAITSAVFVVKKKIFGVFIEIPCVDNVGSCTYNDICPKLANITCPQQFIDMGFSCHCPIAAKDYEVPDGTIIDVPKLPIPSSVENGEYDIKITLMNGSTTLACYEFEASLKSD